MPRDWGKVISFIAVCIHVMIAKQRAPTAARRVPIPGARAHSARKGPSQGCVRYPHAGTRLLPHASVRAGSE